MKFIIIAVVLLFTVIFFLSKMNKQRRKKNEIHDAPLDLRAIIEKNKRKGEVTNIAYQVKKIAEKITSLKTFGARIKNCEKAIELLNQAAKYEECRDVINNYDALLSRIIKIKNVLPVVDNVERSYKYRFKRNNKGEQNALLDALFEIQTKSITNQDILEAEIYPENTGEIVTIEGIQNRLKELGWEDNTNIKPI